MYRVIFLASNWQVGLGVVSDSRSFELLFGHKPYDGVSDSITGLNVKIAQTTVDRIYELDKQSQFRSLCAHLYPISRCNCMIKLVRKVDIKLKRVLSS